MTRSCYGGLLGNHRLELNSKLTFDDLEKNSAGQNIQINQTNYNLYRSNKKILTYKLLGG